jgi:hydrogenase-4 component E
MTGLHELLLWFVIILGLYTIAVGQLKSAIRATAFQGAAVALLPVTLWGDAIGADPFHLFLLGLAIFAVKAVIIPLLMLRALRLVGARQVQSYISRDMELIFAVGLMGIAFWFSGVLVPPRPVPSNVVVPAALVTVLLGLLVLVSRRKAISQVVGYLMVENGVFIYGQGLGLHIPFAVELGIFLDLLVGVFVMGIAIHHISREFDHIDTEFLAELKDYP